MAQTNHHSPVATAYAQSLLELASEQEQAEAVGQELQGLREVLEQTPTFRLYLGDPAVSAEERQGVLERTLGGQVSPLVMNFLKVANDRGRLGELPGIIDAYDDLLDQKLGKVEVDVTVAQRLGRDDLERVRQKVSQALGKDAIIHQYVDESIIGGLVLRVQDRLIDASVRSQLQAIREKLLAAAPR